jgi:hypothetical protein
MNLRYFQDLHDFRKFVDFNISQPVRQPYLITDSIYTVVFDCTVLSFCKRSTREPNITLANRVPGLAFRFGS